MDKFVICFAKLLNFRNRKFEKLCSIDVIIDSFASNCHALKNNFGPLLLMKQ